VKGKKETDKSDEETNKQPNKQTGNLVFLFALQTSVRKVLYSAALKNDK